MHNRRGLKGPTLRHSAIETGHATPLKSAVNETRRRVPEVQTHDPKYDLLAERLNKATPLERARVLVRSIEKKLDHDGPHWGHYIGEDIDELKLQDTKDPSGKRLLNYNNKKSEAREKSYTNPVRISRVGLAKTGPRFTKAFLNLFDTATDTPRLNAKEGEVMNFVYLRYVGKLYVLEWIDDLSSGKFKLRIAIASREE